MNETDEPQRIVKLTPLPEVLESFALTVDPVAVRTAKLQDAIGRTLASDVALDAARPATALALRDGYAVQAELTLDASDYAPVPLSPPPPAVETGDAIPEAADAVAPPETIQSLGGMTTISAPLAAGDGVLPAGGDAPAGVLRLAGARLRRIDIALLSSLEIEQVEIRVPQLKIVCAAPGASVQAAAAWLASAVEADGGDAKVAAEPLASAFTGGGFDAIIAVGGTGIGKRDTSVRTLARHGRVAFHGIAIQPGETSAFGFTESRPVLLLPGRLDAVLAGWLTIGRRLLARMAFRLIEDQPFPLELSRKVSSPLGLTEIVPVRRRASTVEPIAQGYIPPKALARADGWILVPADSEGYAAGTKVMVRPWP